MARVPGPEAGHELLAVCAARGQRFGMPDHQPGDELVGVTAGPAHDLGTADAIIS